MAATSRYQRGPLSIIPMDHMQFPTEVVVASTLQPMVGSLRNQAPEADMMAATVPSQKACNLVVDNVADTARIKIPLAFQTVKWGGQIGLDQGKQAGRCWHLWSKKETFSDPWLGAMGI